MSLPASTSAQHPRDAIAIHEYIAQKLASNAAPGMKSWFAGKNRLVVVEERDLNGKKETHVEFRKLNIIERCFAKFGFGNAAFKNVILACVANPDIISGIEHRDKAIFKGIITRYIDTHSFLNSKIDMKVKELFPEKRQDTSTTTTGASIVTNTTTSSPLIRTPTGGPLATLVTPSEPSPKNAERDKKVSELIKQLEVLKKSVDSLGPLESTKDLPGHHRHIDAIQRRNELEQQIHSETDFQALAKNVNSAISYVKETHDVLQNQRKDAKHNIPKYRDELLKQIEEKQKELQNYKNVLSLPAQIIGITEQQQNAELAKVDEFLKALSEIKISKQELPTLKDIHSFREQLSKVVTVELKKVAASCGKIYEDARNKEKEKYSTLYNQYSKARFEARECQGVFSSKIKKVKEEVEKEIKMQNEIKETLTKFNTTDWINLDNYESLKERVSQGVTEITRLNTVYESYAWLEECGIQNKIALVKLDYPQSEHQQQWVAEAEKCAVDLDLEVANWEDHLQKRVAEVRGLLEKIKLDQLPKLQKHFEVRDRLIKKITENVCSKAERLHITSLLDPEFRNPLFYSDMSGSKHESHYGSASLQRYLDKLAEDNHALFDEQVEKLYLEGIVIDQSSSGNNVYANNPTGRAYYENLHKEFRATLRDSIEKKLLWDFREKLNEKQIKNVIDIYFRDPIKEMKYESWDAILMNLEKKLNELYDSENGPPLNYNFNYS